MPSAIKNGLRLAGMILIVLTSLPIAAQAHRNGGYSHDTGVKTRNSRWMTALNGGVRLGQLSIPGTHDSMAFYGGDIARAQMMSLEDQLTSGIRVLDIRCRQIDNVFAIHHGMDFQNAYFGDVLDTVRTFLLNNPGETVLVRVKPEWKAAHNTQPFDHTFHDRYWEPNPSWFWNPPSNPDNPPPDPSKPPPSKLDDDNPKLDAVRGKIVILQDFYGPRYGISYSTLNEQDDYEMKNERELYHKWLKVKDQLAAANDGNTDVIYINYLSGGGGTLPWFVASGHYESGTKDNRLTTGKTTPAWNDWKDFPRLDCLRNVCTIAYEGTNVLTYERVGKDYKNRVGIIMADFPGGGLIDRVIGMNDCMKTTPHCSKEAKPFIRK